MLQRRENMGRGQLYRHFRIQTPQYEPSRYKGSTNTPLSLALVTATPRQADLVQQLLVLLVLLPDTLRMSRAQLECPRSCVSHA